jgi:hypothetical protein
MIHDEHNFGSIPLATVLAFSSNVGMAHLALSLEPKQIWGTLDALGFGQVTASGFPGESAGQLSNYSHWRSVLIGNMSHGYGPYGDAAQLWRRPTPRSARWAYAARSRWCAWTGWCRAIACSSARCVCSSCTCSNR